MGLELTFNIGGNNTYNFVEVMEFVDAANFLMDNETSSNAGPKYKVYEDAFGVPFRHKLTGFEYVQNLDQQYRPEYQEYMEKTASPQVIEATQNFSHIIKKEIEHKTSAKTYKDAIKNYRKALLKRAEAYRDQHSLVYLSGGADSELMARVLKEAGNEFSCVTFMLTVPDEDITSEYDYSHDIKDLEKFPDIIDILQHIPEGETVINLHDIKYAIQYAKENSVNLLLRCFNVKKLWESEYVKTFMQRHNITSPLILSQRYMCELIDREIKDLGFYRTIKIPYLYYEIDK